LSAHYFVSDGHVGGGRPRSEARLFHFLRSLRGRADSLYILGDLFEFWFEYGRAIPKTGFRVLAELAELAEGGTQIHYLRGNHDFWFRDFLQRELGADAADEMDVTVDGLRVFLAHGDALDRAYVARFFRFLIRRRFNGMLYSLIHPDLGIGIAQRLALASRRVGAAMYLREAMARFAASKLAAGFDVVLLGHSHSPETRQFGHGVYINTGDWLRHFTYGVIRDGVPALERFDGD
jgi:UDP-2,3-diacylglucosamine hydrolase